MTHEQLAEILKDSEINSELDLLNEREIELFSLLSQGTPSHLITVEMGIQADELAGFKTNIRNKLGLKNDIQLLQFAAKHKPRRDD
jgi:DNA-binding NarL/FixJ family response regulator